MPSVRAARRETAAWPLTPAPAGKGSSRAGPGRGAGLAAAVTYGRPTCLPTSA